MTIRCNPNGQPMTIPNQLPFNLYLTLYPHCDLALFPGFELPIRYSYSTPYIGNMQGTVVPPYPGRVADIHTHGAESPFMLYGDLGSRVFSKTDKETAHE